MRADFRSTVRLTGLWVRGALRRRSRGVLVVGGLLAMALAVMAAMVGADTLKQVLVADARAQWGAVDVTVSAPGNQLMEESLARMVGSDAPAKAWAGRLLLPAVAEHARTRDPHAQLIAVSEEERAFAEPLTGRGVVHSASLAPDEVIVNERLARRLGLSVGDRLGLLVAVPHTEWRTPGGRLSRERAAAAVEWPVSVAGIATDAGLADLGRTANVLARLDTAQRATGLEGKVSALHAAASDEGPVAAERLADTYDDVARRVGLVPVQVKQEALEVADDEAGQFIGIFASLALLVVLGSAALTVNLVILLGYERSREVALMRAAGARRGTVTALLLTEAAVYTVVAAGLGAVLAVPLGNLLAGGVAEHFAAIELGRGREFVTFSAQARPGTIALALALVMVVGLLAGYIGARRVGSLDVERVLRGLPPGATAPEPTDLRRPFLAAATGALLLGMGITASAGADFYRFAGLSLLLTAWWLRARRKATDRRRLDAVAAAGGVVWFVGAPAVLGDFARGVESSFALLAVAGAGAVVCATVLLGTRLRTVMRLVRGYLPRGRTQAATRTAGAWAEQHRGRAGAVIGLVAVALFMVGVMSVLGRATAIDVDRQRGGLDAIGTSIGPVDPKVLAKAEGVANLVALEHTVVGEQSFATEDSDGARSMLRWPVRVVRANPELADLSSFGLADALPRYATAGAAIQDVATAGRGVILDRYSRPEGAQPGDRVMLDLGAGKEEFELLAVLDTYLLGAVVIGPDAYDDLVANRGATMVLAVADTHTDAPSMAAALDDVGRSSGLTMLTVSEVAARITQINASFTDLFSMVLQIGLGVALFAVGALVHRALRERRAEFAVLRASGFRRADLVLAVLAEPLLLGVTGLGIGIVVGIGTLVLLFWTGFADLAFQVHWGQLGGTAALCVVLIVVSCLLPAIQASRRHPDIDLRNLG